jgi:hypothetical protein
MIKFIFRWAFRFLILAIVVVVALVLLKDQILKSVVEGRIRAATGMDVRIGAVHTDLTRPVFDVEGFVLYNVPEFGGGPLLDIPDLHVEFYTDAASRKEIHCKFVRMNVREFSIVESRDGRTNIANLVGMLNQQQRPGSNGPGAVTFKGIDTLNLTVSKVRYVNLRIPNRSQDVNITLQNEIILNVRTWDDLAAILLKTLLRAGIPIYFDQPTSQRAQPSSAPLPNSPARLLR